MALGWPEHVPGRAMMPMGGAGQPMDNLDLRFPMFLEHMFIWTYVFTCVGALGRSRCTPVQPNRPRPSLDKSPLEGILRNLGLGREPLRRVQVPLCLISVT